MKIIAAVLVGLLLVVGPIYAQQNCQKEVNQTYYFVYNTSVELKTYYCSYTDEEDLQCENYNSEQLQTNESSGVTHNCKNGFWRKVQKLFSLRKLKISFCELSASTSLLENIVKFSDNTLCLRHYGTCYNINISKNVFWSVNDMCQSLLMICNGIFSVWTSMQNQITFISDDYVSLILKEKIVLCGIEMWKTNYENIVVSKNHSSTYEHGKLCPKLESNLNEFCEDKKQKIQISTDIPKTWYVYKYSTEITIHMCLTNVTSSCEEMELIDSDPQNNECISNFCNTTSICNYKSNTTICQATTQVDLEENLVRDLPSQCKYSDGICEPLKAFWLHTDRCTTIQKTYEGYEDQCGITKCVTEEHNSTKLILLRKGTLCGETVWYTDRDDLVASERELQFSVSKTNENLDLLVSQQSEDISRLQTSLFYLKLLVLFCALWYVSSVIVNFMSLRKLNKSQGYKKAPLVSSVSQSLTTHYLCLSREERKIARVVYDVKASQIYASVDNELYNNPSR